MALARFFRRHNAHCQYRRVEHCVVTECQRDTPHVIARRKCVATNGDVGPLVAVSVVQHKAALFVRRAPEVARAIGVRIDWLCVLPARHSAYTGL